MAEGLVFVKLEKAMGVNSGRSERLVLQSATIFISLLLY